MTKVAHKFVRNSKLGDQGIDEGIYVLKTQWYLCDSFVLLS